jgi:hypothetical protein
MTMTDKFGKSIIDVQNVVSAQAAGVHADLTAF